MANIKSQKKRIKTNEKRRLRNSSIYSRMKSMTKKAFQGLSVTDEKHRETAVKQAISSIDRACSKGVIHPGAAARRKSRLMKHVNKTI
ncbi:MAG TPA: 30S ribosomal protein S20 [Candidatus Hydrogenedens sp.]|nr:30S ribosomal protein S20 [Candidatus Hydrogenedens sp.]